MYNPSDHLYHCNTGIQDCEVKATDLSSKKRRTIPLKGGGLLLLELGVVSFSVLLCEITWVCELSPKSLYLYLCLCTDKGRSDPKPL